MKNNFQEGFETLILRLNIAQTNKIFRHHF